MYDEVIDNGNVVGDGVKKKDDERKMNKLKEKKE